MSEKPFYRAAALFLGSQISEASRSLGYDDMMAVVEEYEKTPDIEKVEKDKNLAKLISAINDTRYDDLMDELLFIDVEEEDLDDLLEERARGEGHFSSRISDFPYSRSIGMRNYDSLCQALCYLSRQRQGGLLYSCHIAHGFADMSVERLQRVFSGEEQNGSHGYLTDGGGTW